MKKHSETGWRILSSIDEFSVMAEFVYEHHERWNGNGYPRGLKGNEISLEARIIAVADAYDAMTRDRTYRSTVTREEAAAELVRCAGTQFDPAVVEVFVRQVLADAEALM
jgi:HD-GYP domain-containing protein (c-di-GMP phosphodiesterase class II)